MAQVTKAARFSVLIPVFNRQKLVRLTVDSVLAQTFSDYEVIVIDDGSTDQTVEVLQSYGSRIQVLRQCNSGSEVARSKGAAMATGEYFVLLDSDDLLYPSALANYDRVIRAFNAPPVILGAMSYFPDGETPRDNKAGEDRLELIRLRDFLSKDRGTGISCSNIVIKRSAAEATGALRKEFAAFPFDGNDILLLLGTSEPCILLKQPFTVAYRVHANNTSKRLDFLLETASRLARFERLGHYPGGGRRRFHRYAYVGGVTWHYTAQGLRGGRYRLSLKLLLRTFPMIAIGALNTIARRFRKPLPLVTLSA
jgi:glycosyltransferase involved in cell wall biosynthesis